MVEQKQKGGDVRWPVVPERSRTVPRVIPFFIVAKSVVMLAVPSGGVQIKASMPSAGVLNVVQPGAGKLFVKNI